MDADGPIFAFEADFAGALHCIPMVVRFNLDQCGVKLSLKQWNRFALRDRARLIGQFCDTPQETSDYRSYLIELIEYGSFERVSELVIDPSPAWSVVEQVPERIADYAAGLGLAPPTLRSWTALTPLQRFALFKLTRPGHDNDNFIPALREFGLL